MSIKSERAHDLNLVPTRFQLLSHPLIRTKVDLNPNTSAIVGDQTESNFGVQSLVGGVILSKFSSFERDNSVILRGSARGPGTRMDEHEWPGKSCAVSLCHRVREGDWIAHETSQGAYVELYGSSGEGTAAATREQRTLMVRSARSNGCRGRTRSVGRCQ